MISYVGFKRVSDGATIELNTNIYPLHDFDPTVEERTVTDREKMQEHGKHPTFSYRGGMEIHLEGNIFGSSSSDYWDNRMALIAGIYGSPNIEITDRMLGWFIFEPVGQVRMQTACTVTGFSAPMVGLYPSASELAITFYSFTPYLVGQSTGYLYYIA